jgi:hypothetical protein
MEPMHHAKVSLMKSWETPRTENGERRREKGELADFGKDFGCLLIVNVRQNWTKAATVLSQEPNPP